MSASAYSLPFPFTLDFRFPIVCSSRSAETHDLAHPASKTKHRNHDACDEASSNHFREAEVIERRADNNRARDRESDAAGLAIKIARQHGDQSAGDVCAKEPRGEVIMSKAGTARNGQENGQGPVTAYNHAINALVTVWRLKADRVSRQVGKGLSTGSMLTFSAAMYGA